MEQLSLLITVVPDAVVEVEKQMGTPKNESEEAPFLQKVQSLAVDYAKFSWQMSVFGLGGLAIRSIMEARRRAKSEGLDVQMVGSGVAKDLLFPPGHPRAKVVYMQHPANQRLYYPVASFHRHVFEHKFSEALLLLGALGANTINVQHVKGWSREFAGELSVPIPPSAGTGQAGGSVGTQARTGENLLFHASLRGSNAAAMIDNPVWFPHEPTWQAVAKLRLDHGLDVFSLTVNYEDDFQVNAHLTAAIEGAGFQVGGKFENHQSTVWTMSGEFGARRKD
ncbi:hypothetical protein [Dyella sp. 2HG41-7]|uniref:hypothetical protein n=1 Tax=Dyella sp. 2HG41-7 TaxID=2883239 RepID=UPI001F2574C1|nr:hypothetical protein [Dyella sp. 2HG41-7]